MPTLTLLPSTAISGVSPTAGATYEVPPNATAFVSVLDVKIEAASACVIQVDTSPDGTTWFPFLIHADWGTGGDDTGEYCHSTADTTAGSPRVALRFVRHTFTSITGSATISHQLHYALR